MTTLKITLFLVLSLMQFTVMAKDLDKGLDENLKKDFVFTAIPDQDETKLQQRFGKVADYLENKLGLSVKYIPVKSYAAAVSAFRNNQVQLAWFGGLSGVKARALVDGSEALAQGVEDEQFETYFIANAATNLKAADGFPDYCWILS